MRLDFTLGGNGSWINRRNALDSNRIETHAYRPALEGKLGNVLREASQRAHQQGLPILASLTEAIPLADPLEIFGNAAAASEDSTVWLQPDSGFSITSAGAAYVVESKGSERFAQTAAAWEGLCSSALIKGPQKPVSGPLLIGGFSFDEGAAKSTAWRGYPDGRMVVPRACVRSTQGGSWLTLNAVLRPGVMPEQEAGEMISLLRALVTGPAPGNGHVSAGRPAISELGSAQGWRDEVVAAARAIRQGELRKVVLARAVRLLADQTFDCVAALRRLAAGYPTCVVFAVARGERCFLGATPERLLRVRNGEVSATCLAGSYARGATDEADRRLAEALLADPKERSEHTLVSSALAQALAQSCTRLEMPEVPSVLKLPNVQHLCTPVSGRLAQGHSLLRVVERLHPTPSVGGEPRSLALEFIREREGVDRGWYAGPVGWVDHRGEGEFAVAIRAAILCGGEATLFAGCGIVADSDPQREFAESCIKLTPMLSALGAA